MPSKFGRRKLAYGLACTGILISVVDRMHLVLAAPVWNLHVADRAYYAFDTRADALFLGCLLGLIASGGHLEDWKPRTKRILTIGAAASVVITVWILFMVNVGSRSLPLVWLPVGEIAAAVVIVYFVVKPQGLGTRIIGLSALVLIGNMTYTIYLVHWPVFQAISPSTVQWPFWLVEVVRMAIVIPITLASWYLIEKPLMKWRRRTLDPGHTATPTPPPA